MTSETYAHRASIYVVPPHLAGHPDIVAMLGAFYSRSYQPMRQRIEELGEDTSKVRASLEKWVVGYGHDSILDMCNVTLAIEGIPIMAAVAIEDHPLFAGQETSTRYVDWSTEQFINPLHEDQDAHADIEESYLLLRETYCKVQRGALRRIAEAHGALELLDRPMEELTPDDRAVLLAMRARSFDIARGWLPCGAVTRVCWSGRLSSMRAHLRDMGMHPDENIRILAQRIWRALMEHYPKAMGSVRRGAVDASSDGRYAVARWMPELQTLYQLVDEEDVVLKTPTSECDVDQNALQALKGRGWCEPIPMQIFGLVNDRCTLQGSLDYGSLRDLHRHRRGVHAFLPPTIDNGLQQWYVDMSEKFIDVPLLTEHLAEISERIHSHAYGDEHEAQFIAAHALPLATRSPVSYAMDLDQMAYLFERRTTLDVHPTLRAFLLRALNNAMEEGQYIPFALHTTTADDPGPTGYVLRRGTQTITVGGVDVAHAGSEEKAS